MVMVCMPSCDSEGVQENAPVFWFIEAPVGGAEHCQREPQGVGRPPDDVAV